MALLTKFFTTQGPGGVLVLAVVLVLGLCYALTVRWIAKGREPKS